jgi:signal transduction histidine kinase
VRRRLIVTTTGLVLVAVLALAIPLALAVRGVLATRAIDTVQGVAEQAGLLLDVTARTCGELQLRVAQLGQAPASLTVLATDRTLVASTAEGPVAVDTDAFAAAASAGRVGRSIADGRITVAAPLATTVCGQPLVLQATQDDAELRAAVRGAWLAIAGVAVVVAAGAAAFAGWSARRLAQPFESLATSARTLGDGDFSTRAPRSGLPEADAIAEALDGTAERLGRAVERASAFTADASHQLRTPLTALRLQLDTAQALLASGAQPGGGAEDQPADHCAAALAAAEVEADRLETTIEDLVALTRLDGPDTEVELPALVAARLDGWRALAAEQDRDVVLEVAEPIPVVRARPGAIAQILQVLLDNALLHAEGPIRVEMAVARGSVDAGAAATVRVCVVDQGPLAGAAADEHEAREAPAYTRVGGKGLPLARSLAAAEGGQVTFASEGAGTRACLLLPAAGGVGAAREPSTSPQ